MRLELTAFRLWDWRAAYCATEAIERIRTKTVLPTGGLEPPIFGLGDRRLIHWATRAVSTAPTILESIRTQLRKKIATPASRTRIERMIALLERRHATFGWRRIQAIQWMVSLTLCLTDLIWKFLVEFCLYFSPSFINIFCYIATVLQCGWDI